MLAGARIKLRTQWAAPVAAWRPQPPGVIFPNKAVVKYWADLRKNNASELSDIATLQWRRPISSASVERICSILTRMDDAMLRPMGRTLLEQLHFLAGNARVVSGLLLHVFAESTRRAAEVPTEGRLKRRRGAEAAVVQRAREGAAAALRAREGAAAAAPTAAGGACCAASDDDGRPSMSECS